MKKTIIAAVALALTATACAPGSDSPSGGASAPSTVQTDAAALGQVELTVWDQEVRGGQAAQMAAQIKGFEAKYPNIKIKRVSRSFDDLKTTLRLALSGNDAPDVVQANNGRSDMGEFVKAGQLVPLDKWAEAYKWGDRYPASVLQYSRYSADGKTFGEGNLYGLPQVGEVVGLYYNKTKVPVPPKDWADFENAMTKARAGGDVPLQLGNLDKWPAIHVFGTIQDQFVPADQITKLAFGRPEASWKTPENLKAAETLVSWVNTGYFNTGFNGQGYDPAWQDFGKGKGTFLIAGTWLQADLQKALGDKVGFMLPPGAPAVTGGTGLPFAITNKAKNPDAAAAYINYITSPDAMKVLTDTGNLPIADTAAQQAPAGLAGDIFKSFGTAVGESKLVPYLDYATPTMYDTLGAALQDLLAKKATPQQFLDKLEADYSKYAGK
ncbi:extracellular solute-binding protein [Kribbella sp. NPDC056345]|uniref:extracellular solute-binding protein n=1 Tax=Kribbella sp. NPDC056345 TaxID=3345789 RepID=UPI0035DD2B97